MNAQDFAAYQLPAPTFDDVAARFDQIASNLEAAATSDEAVAAVRAWDALRRELETWSSVVHIRFTQDTKNADFVAAREYCDQLRPRLTDLHVAMKRRLLASSHRPALEQEFGAQAFSLWKCDVAAFDPIIEQDLVEQSRLDAKYTELLASPKFEFRGESLTLSELQKFAEHPERDVRFDAANLRWGWFGENQRQLDDIFQSMVQLRHGMSQKLGMADYVELAYLLMQRVDYDRHDVEKFRAEVREHVVPLATEIRRRQANRLGIDPLMAWDEALHDPAGNPRPQGDHDWMIAQAGEMFDQVGGGMGQFFEVMKERNLMDLKSRDGKAGGGYCCDLANFGPPFIFANFNGTKGDVEVFTHEMGHAFQNYCSRDLPLFDYLWPTTESCEIHSMGLEYLTWPQMELFFGDDAERFRRLHLTQSLLFLPYGVSVDHFQHLVYEEPDASPDRRAEMWQEMEQIYLPTLRWGDLAHPASGRRWQAQLHIYGSPFEYLDYALALTCALQLWQLSEQDRGRALEVYGALCRQGGQAPFGELLRDAGLQSPFAAGCLAKVVEHAKQRLAS